MRNIIVYYQDHCAQLWDKIPQRLRHVLQGQLRIRDVDGVAAEKLDGRERAVGYEGKLLVPLHEFSGFRNPLCFLVLEAVLADAS